MGAFIAIIYNEHAIIQVAAIGSEKEETQLYI